MADVSLVIPSQHGGAPLIETVAAFAEATGGAVEIVVAECAGDDTGSRIRSRWSAVRVVHLEPPQTIPQLRAAALSGASGRIVAMTGDACAPGRGWLAALRRAHDAAPGAVGGAIENGSTDRLIDWAVFFCEYGRYMTPLAPEPAHDLPAQNVSYSREALASIDDLVRRATWEPLWHWRLASHGTPLVRDGAIVVVLRRRYSFAGFARERFDYGRSFAAQRTESSPVATRLLFAAGCVVLPAVVLFRIVRDVLSKRRHTRELLLSLPYLGMFACLWAAGEGTGYVFGSRAEEIRGATPLGRR